MYSSKLATIQTRLSRTHASQFLKLKMRLHSACQVKPGKTPRTKVFWISGSCEHPGGKIFQNENFQITRHS